MQPRHMFGISCTYSFLLRAVSYGHSLSQCPIIAFCFATHQEPLGLGLGPSVGFFPRPPCLEFVWLLPCPVSYPLVPLFPSCPLFPVLGFWGVPSRNPEPPWTSLVFWAFLFFGCQCLLMVLAISSYVLNLSAVYFLISAIDSPSGLTRSGRTSFFLLWRDVSRGKMAVVTSDGKGCLFSLRLDKASILFKICSAAMGISACDFAGWRFLISS